MEFLIIILEQKENWINQLVLDVYESGGLNYHQDVNCQNKTKHKIKSSLLLGMLIINKLP